ncbi:MAG TPA: hypothetical protein VMY06_02415 [Sedimentisphaerales bacterium]|nr:hypothetical protein [Sedimentisphaerales bacterium]
MTDVRLTQFGARFLDFAPMLSDESTGAPLEMTMGCVSAFAGMTTGDSAGG